MGLNRQQASGLGQGWEDRSLFPPSAPMSGLPGSSWVGLRRKLLHGFNPRSPRASPPDVLLGVRSWVQAPGGPKGVTAVTGS